MKSESEDDRLGKIADEFLSECRQGASPDVDAFAERYPEFADDLRELLPTLAMMEQIKSDGPDEGPLVDHAESMIQRELGDYRILREIGRGGMGIVYEAEQISLGRRVAIKVMPKQVALSPDNSLRFEREAKAAARLHHTNIVPVFGVGDDDEVHYYVMQFIHGLGLDEVLRELERSRTHPAVESEQSRRFETSWQSGSNPDSSNSGSSGNPYWRNVGRIGFQVSDALRYAHAQGVVHRDIKPSNLLLDSQNDVWITDFGLAKADDEAGLTRSGDILGTIRYMPPEAFSGQVDHRGDLYSLGITLYELVALQPAFAADDRRELIKKVTTTRPTPITRMAKSVPRDLATIIEKAIEVEPSDRYQTAAAFEEDLRRFMADEPILARRVGLAERAVRWSRQNRALAASLVGVVTLLSLLAVGGLSAAWYFFEQEEKQRGLLEKTVVMSDANESLLGELQVALSDANVAKDSALEARDDAERESERAWDNLYVSDVASAIRVINDHHGYERAMTLLDRWRPETGQPYRRGWEWYFALSLCNEHLFDIDAHESTVHAIALDGSGERLVSAGSDGWIRFWDMDRRKLIKEIESPVGEPFHVAWEPGGSRVAIGGYAGFAILNGDSYAIEHASLSLFKVCGLEWSPDGTRIALATSMRRVWAESGTYSILDATKSDFPVLAVPPGKPNRAETRLTQMGWSQDGERLVYLSGANLKVWNLAADKLDTEFRLEGSARPYSVTFRGPDNDEALVCSRYGNVELYDLKSGKIKTRYLGNSDTVLRVQWDDSGDEFATVSADGAVRWWNSAQSDAQQQFQGHIGEVRAIEVVPSRRWLLSAGDGGKIKCWDIGSPASRRRLMRVPNLIRGCAIAPNGDKVAATTVDGAVHFVDVDRESPVRSFAGHGTDLRAVAFSPDGSDLFCGGSNGKLQTWDAVAEKQRHEGNAGGHVQCADWDPRGSLIATGMRGGSIKLFDPQLRRLTSEIPRMMKVSSVCFNHDGSSLAFGTARHELCVWDFPSEQLRRVSLADVVVSHVAWSVSGRKLAAACSDRSIRIWNESLELQLELPNRAYLIRSLRFSPDETRLLAVDRLGGLMMYDLDRRKVVFSAQAGVGETWAADWSQDGMRIVCSVDDAVEIWDATRGYAAEQAEADLW